MKKIFLIMLIALTLGGCKEEKKPNAAAVSPAKRIFSVQDLATKSLADKNDWTRDLDVYVDDVLICANASPVQVKYVFRADAFETPPIALILFKGEDDKIYACSMEADNPAPHYKQIKLAPPEKSPRFYPGELPKADSCINNTRVLDKTGHIAGWLSKITC